MAFFDNIYDNDRLESMSEEELNAVAEIFGDYSLVPLFVVTDGIERIRIYRNRGGFLLCDNYPSDANGLAYWDYYSDLLEFACEYNPQISMENVWLEDVNYLV